MKLDVLSGSVNTIEFEVLPSGPISHWSKSAPADAENERFLIESSVATRENSR